MQYMGGKGRIAKQLTRVMLDLTQDRDTYLEPFVGGGWVFAQMAPHFRSANCGDAMPDVALMWQAVAQGWVPPTEMSKERWYELKVEQPSPERAFAGFGCSFGGRFFEGYAKNGRQDDFVGAAYRAIQSKRLAFTPAHIMHRSYSDWSWLAEQGGVIYCDPPYVGTKWFSGAPAWDPEPFWSLMTEWGQHSTVFVSEYVAPSGWECVWEKEVKVSINSDTNASTAIERLFMKAGPA